MLAVAFVLVLVVGCMWMESRLEKASPAAALGLPFMVEVDGDGLTLRKGASMTAWMRWEDIRVVRAFKVDCYGRSTPARLRRSMVPEGRVPSLRDVRDGAVPCGDGLKRRQS